MSSVPWLTVSHLLAPGFRILGRHVRRSGLAVLDTLLPPRCLGCGRTTEAVGALCAACWAGISFLGPPCCACCGLPFAHDLGTGVLCAGCAAQKPAFDRARAVLRYDDASRRLILSLKHGDKLQGVPAFGGWLARAGADLIAEADIVAPVPLHWTRLFARRYNQSAVLAHGLAKAARRSGAPIFTVIPDLLIRRRRTPSQGRLSRTGRASNVGGAFALHRGRSVRGKRVLLIDDVLTSGATAEECARVLRRAGAAGVDVLTLARAIRAD
jgi:ComF family protein